MLSRTITVFCLSFDGRNLSSTFGFCLDSRRSTSILVSIVSSGRALLTVIIDCMPHLEITEVRFRTHTNGRELSGICLTILTLTRGVFFYISYDDCSVTYSACGYLLQTSHRASRIFEHI